MTLDGEGRFTPKENNTDTRNPRCADIFFGMSAMEWEGTGLVDVDELMAGSRRQRGRSPGNVRFEAHLFRVQALQVRWR